MTLGMATVTSVPDVTRPVAEKVKVLDMKRALVQGGEKSTTVAFEEWFPTLFEGACLANKVGARAG